jgi:hypothetical protein
LFPAPSTPDPTRPEPDACRPEDFPFRVLLAVPEALTIPLFALGAEARREPVEAEVISDKEAFSRLVGGNLFRTLAQGRYGEHRFVKTRRRSGQRTAVYAFWLAFPELAQAEAFVGDHPRFGLTAIEARAQAEVARHEADLRNGAVKGRYNLGPLEHRARLNRAREYVQASEEIDRMSWGLSALKRLRESLAAVPGLHVGRMRAEDERCGSRVNTRESG